MQEIMLKDKTYEDCCFTSYDRYMMYIVFTYCKILLNVYILIYQNARMVRTDDYVRSIPMYQSYTKVPSWIATTWWVSLLFTCYHKYMIYLHIVRFNKVFISYYTKNARMDRTDNFVRFKVVFPYFNKYLVAFQPFGECHCLWTRGPEAAFSHFLKSSFVENFVTLENTKMYWNSFKLHHFGFITQLHLHLHHFGSFENALHGLSLLLVIFYL